MLFNKLEIRNDFNKQYAEVNIELETVKGERKADSFKTQSFENIWEHLWIMLYNNSFKAYCKKYLLTKCSKEELESFKNDIAVKLEQDEPIPTSTQPGGKWDGFSV